jgi:hypothetical protein
VIADRAMLGTGARGYGQGAAACRSVD